MIIHPTSVICVSVCPNEEVFIQFLNYFSFDVVISLTKGSVLIQSEFEIFVLVSQGRRE